MDTVTHAPRTAARLPARGPAVRSLGLAFPPQRMPLLHRRRLRKHWSYVGVYSPALQLCVADARIGPGRLRWWALAEPGQPIRGRTSRLGSAGVALGDDAVVVRSGGVEIDLRLERAGDAVEVASSAGDAYIWTEKRPLSARGSVSVDGRRVEVEAPAISDRSAGYHDRHTAWRWSAGAGRSVTGAPVWWNLVEGIHDAPEASERTVWIHGRAGEAAPARIATDLSAISSDDGADLRFSAWSEREERTSLGLMRSYYRQPFGEFSGTLPGGVELAQGFGVMEEHDVVW